MKKIIILFAFLGLTLTLSASAVSFPNPINATTIPGVINAIINFILIISVPLLSGAVIYGGLLMITSGGDPAKFSTAVDLVAHNTLRHLCLLYPLLQIFWAKTDTKVLQILKLYP